MKKKMLEFVEPLSDNISVKQILNIINEKYPTANLNDCRIEPYELDNDFDFDVYYGIRLIIEREETDEEYNKRTNKTNISKLKKEFGKDYNYNDPKIVESLVAISNAKENAKKDPEYMKQLMISAGILDKDGNLTEHYRGGMDA